MTFELSTPVKLTALLGLLGIMLAAAGAVYTMSLHKHQTVLPVQTAKRAGTAHPSRSVTFATPAAPKLRPVVVDANLPAPLRNALRDSKTVVAVVWAPGIAGDSDVVQAARQGAAAARTGFAALNVSQDSIAAALAAWEPSASDPAVLVVKRPGIVVAELDGWANQTMVAQAALNTK